MRVAIPLVLALAATGLARAQPAPPKLAFPLACTIGKTCEVQHYVDRDPGPGALDYRCGHRTYDKHDGIDIRLLDMKAQQRGVDVLAAASGRVVATRDGVAEGLFIKGGRPAVAGLECGNRVAIAVADGWIVDSCHLAKGSIRVKQGDVVTAGQPIAKVGLSGMTEFPHLHISVRHNNVLVDPFSPAAAAGCPAPQAGLWTPEAARAMAYKAGAILNAGVAGGPVTMATIQAGEVPAVTASAPAIVAYLFVIEPQKGDVLEATLKGPAGVLASGKSDPLESDKAQYFTMAGKKRPPAGWPKGVYTAELKVWRAGKAVMARTVTETL